MTRFRAILGAELWRQLGHPLTLIAAGLVALVSFHEISLTGPTASGLIRIGRIAHDAPLIVAELVSAVIVPGLFLVALLVGPCVQRDFAHRSSPFFFTTPVSRMEYLGGRFLGGFSATLLLPVGAVLGMTIAWATLPASFVAGVRPWGLVAAVAYSLPTLLFFAALFFTIATLSRTMIAVYAVAVGAMVFVVMAQGMATELLVRGAVDGDALRWMLLLVDPTGRAPLAFETLTWSVADRSRRLIPLAMPLLLNRALWTAGAGALLALTYHRFTFGHPAGALSRADPGDDAVERVASRREGVPFVAPPTRRGLGAAAAAFVRLTLVELRWMAGHLVFLVLAALTLAQVFGNFVGNVRAAGVLPRTGFLVNEGLAGIDVPAVMLTLFFAGVVLWREHDTGEFAMTHTMPVSDGVFVAAKLAALVLLQATYASLIVGAGLFAQLVLFRTTHIQPALYVKAVLGLHLLGWVQIAVALLLLQILAARKQWGFVVGGVAVLWAGVAPSFGLDSPMFRFGAVPAHPYSEMNGFGPFAEPIVVYRVMWTAAGFTMFALSVAAWSRGGRRSAIAARRSAAVAIRRHPLTFVAPIVATLACVTLLLIRHGEPGLMTAPSGEDLRAIYEARHKRFETLAQPSISEIDLRVDLQPRHETADIAGTYLLTNRTPAPLGALHLTLLPTYLRDRPVYALDRPGRIVDDDSRTGYTTLELETPLDPGGSMTLTFELRVRQPPMASSATPNALVANGSVIANFVGDVSFFPLVGYRRELEVQDPDVRARHGLPRQAEALRRLDHPDAAARASRDWVRFGATVSTDVDQRVVTAGTVVDTWTTDGRRYSRFVVEAPMANEFAIVSGRYAVAHARVEDVDIEINYHPGHAMNVERMLSGLKTGLAFGIEHFGPYPYRTLRIVEVPDYGTVHGTAISKPGLILWNENGGFLAAPTIDGAVDSVFSTAAHETGHQWWGHQVRPAAGVEGALALNETLAQYVRLRSLRSQFSPRAVREFLSEERRAYLVLRGHSTQPEHPLITTSETFVAYHKGSLAMAALVDELGEPIVDAALRRLVDTHALLGPPYPTMRDMMEALRAVAPASASELLADWFETITFHETALTDVTAVRHPDGRWRVTVDATFAKLRADELGDRSDVPFRGTVDVGLHDARGALLLLRPLSVTATRQSFDFSVTGEPVSATLDPYGHLLELDRDDNVKAVRR